MLQTRGSKGVTTPAYISDNYTIKRGKTDKRPPVLKFPKLRRTPSDYPPYFDACKAESLGKQVGELIEVRRRVSLAPWQIEPVGEVKRA